MVEAIAAEGGEGVNAFAKIAGIISVNDLKLWRKLDHEAALPQHR